MKSMTQSVAVDMWAVGVTFLSLLSRSYPFFRWLCCYLTTFTTKSNSSGLQMI